MPTDPFQSVTAEADEQKKKMLEAAATAGTAGLAAYDEARKQNEATQLAAVQRAAQLASSGVAGTPGDTGGMADLGALQAQALQTGRAGFEGGINQMKASNESYMGKLLSTLPILKQQNDVKVKTREMQLGAIAAEKAAQIQREKEAADLEFQRKLDLWDRQRKAEVEDRDFAANLAREELNWRASEGAKDRAATTSAKGGSGSGSALADLSDSELKNYVLGAAQNTQAQAKPIADKPFPMPALSSPYAYSSGNLADPATHQAGLDMFNQRQSWTRAKEIMNTPLAQLALDLGVNLGGLDPNRMYGILREELKDSNEQESIAQATKIAGGASVVNDIINNKDVIAFMNGVAGDTEATPESIKASILRDFPGPNKQRTRAVLEYLLT